MIRMLFFWLVATSTLVAGYGDLSAFKYIAFDNQREWYYEEEELRQIWLEAYQEHSGRLISCGAEGADLATRIYDKFHPREYDQIMLLLPWWDYEFIRRKKAKSRFGKNEVRFEITLAAIDGSIIAKFDHKAESIKWQAALRKAIDGTFDKLVYHYKGYDASRKYSFPEFEKRFSGLEILPNFGRKAAIEYLNKGSEFTELEGIWKSDNYFGRVPAEFAIFYLSNTDSHAIVSITEDLFGLKQGSVIGEFSYFERNLHSGQFVDCFEGKFEVGLEIKGEEIDIFQLTTRRQQGKQWNLTKVYTPERSSSIVNALPNAPNDGSVLSDLTYLGQGSGYQIPQSNIIFTNQHVVDGANFVRIIFEGSPEELNAEVLMLDEANDLAILRVQDLRGGANEISLDLSLGLGDKVRVFGYPDIENLGSNLKYSEGVVSSTVGLDKPNWLQMNAEIYPGSSGGPVFNSSGALLGISVAGMESYTNVNYAVKAAYLIALLEQYNVPYKIGKSLNGLSIKEMSQNVCLIKCYNKAAEQRDPKPLETLKPETADEEENITLIASGNVLVLVKQLDDNQELFRKTLAGGETVSLVKSGPIDILFSAGENLIIVNPAGEKLRPKGEGTAKISIP